MKKLIAAAMAAAAALMFTGQSAAAADVVLDARAAWTSRLGDRVNGMLTARWVAVNGGSSRAASVSFLTNAIGSDGKVATPYMVRIALGRTVVWKEPNSSGVVRQILPRAAVGNYAYVTGYWFGSRTASAPIKAWL